MDLNGKTAFVTGASQGIGRACALVLAEAGADVVVASRNLERLEQVAEEIRALGRKALAVALDLSRPETVPAAFKSLQEKEDFSKIDILVNNAGVTRDGLLLRMKMEAWRQVLETNLTGAYLCTQAVLSGMVRRRYGRIVNITSVVAQAGNSGQANYISSKAGLIGLSKAVAAEVASRNITVNAVAPGLIETAMTENLTDEVKSKMLERVPLGRMGTDREVAHAVRFLASPEADYITGHVLNVNGGMYM
ncbi:MAG: 3-oxoacyl-[acyl-carrier-protein] reductase [Acidobacteria bacterium]|nr:3-oxoacyl-[acyl-carrier-protein] reductase [Acidobacteriota bacterium]